jgi:hypothetical protein
MSLRSLIVLLAVMAFSILASPASAMSEVVTFESEGYALPEETEVEAFSSNFVLSMGSELQLKCAENEISASLTENPGATASVTASRFQATGGGTFCKTDLSPRVEAKVTPVTFEAPLDFSAEGGNGYAETTAKFTIEVFDRSVEPGEPIAECTFEGTLSFEYELEKAITGGNAAKVSGTAVNLPKESFGECGFKGTFSGSFAVSAGGAPAVVVEGELPPLPEPVALRDINEEDPGSIVLLSEDMKISTGSFTVDCAESEFKATRRSEGRYTNRQTRIEGGVEEGSAKCPVLGPPAGRVTARVRPVEFRSDTKFSKAAEGKVEVTAKADFEILFKDPTLGGSFLECKFEAAIKGRMVEDEITLEESTATLLGKNRISPFTGCPESAEFTGEFRVTDREGQPVVAM